MKFPSDIASEVRQQLIGSGVRNQLHGHILEVIIADCQPSHTHEDDRTVLTQKILIVDSQQVTTCIGYILYRVRSVYSTTDYSSLRKVRLYDENFTSVSCLEIDDGWDEPYKLGMITHYIIEYMIDKSEHLAHVNQWGL